MLVRAPRDCLDGGCVLTEARVRLRHLLLCPYEKFIIVAARRELVVVEAPAQAAHLLSMAREPSDQRLLRAHIAEKN